MAQKENWNVQFIDNYEKLRRFLRPVSYGCFSRSDICKILDIKKRRYQQLARNCFDILPEGILSEEDQDKNRKGHRRVQIRGNNTYGSENFLAKTYMIKSLTQLDIFLKLSILRILKQNKQGLTRKEIEDKLLSPTFDASITPHTVKQHLERLFDLGLLYRSKKQVSKKGKPQTAYHLAKDYLGTLTTSEVKELLFAIDFYKNISPLSVPGYYLSATLREKYHLPISNQPFQYENYDIRCILEDGLVYQLLQVIRYNQQDNGTLLIRFQYRKNEHEDWRDLVVQPISLLRDDLMGSKVQLIDAKQNRYRLDCIRNVRVQAAVQFRKAKQLMRLESNTMILKFHYQDEQEKHKLRQRIMETLPQPQIHEETDHAFFCTIAAPRNHVQLLPLLRTFLPQLELPASEKVLRHRLTEQIERALNYYEHQ